MKTARTNPRRVRGPVAIALVVLLGASGVAHARAKLIDLHAAILGGGMIGDGTEKVAPDFFRQTRGPGLGAELGLRLVIVDVSIRFLQMLGSDGRQGTLTSIMLGPMVEIPVKGGGKDAFGNSRPPQIVVRPGLAVGVGFGTPAPVSPPLTADQISGKGLMVLGRFAVERMFGPIFGLGVEVEGGYHYFLGASGLATGNDRSSGWQVAGFGTLAFHFGI